VQLVKLARCQMQDALRDREVGVGRDDMDVIRLHVDAVRGFADWHRHGSHEQVHQGARMRRVQMLHDDERHTSRRRQMFEELGERLEAARGCTDADNGKGRTWFRDPNVVSRGRRAP